ncbi:putative secreted protein [hydrothermal vent metagenome]|uniref:Putative secreted protein n=1 Tax=hydrothermal vent metagenome TaxID=652676 RepID=A0A1W1D0K1_9ZZZZ
MGINEAQKEESALAIQDKPYTEPPEYIEYISYKNNDNNYNTESYNNKNIQKTLNSIKTIAKSFLGTPYVWGATGPKKFDCSGFTRWVYRDIGIKIPRVSRDQARVGQYVSYSNLQPGDMVFFDTKKHRSGKVTHVGIYLGNGDFIHASSAGKKVVIYNFNKKEYYKKRFLWGRRLVKPNSKYALN